MRRLAAILLAACALLLLAGCAGTTSERPMLRVVPAKNYHEFTACVANDCGGYAVTLEWGALNFANTTGYYTFANSTQVGSPTSSPYTFYGMDCGQTYTLGVEAHNSSGLSGVSARYTTPYTTPPCGPPLFSALHVAVVNGAGEYENANNTVVHLTGVLEERHRVHVSGERRVPGRPVRLDRVQRDGLKRQREPPGGLADQLG